MKSSGEVKNFFGAVGSSVGFVLAGVHRLFELFLYVLRTVLSAFYQKGAIRKDHVVLQMVLMGVESLAIVCLVGGSVGMVMALQGAYQLQQMGAEIYTGSLVAVTMTRELGPLVAAIVIAGRIGASIAAELGTMKVQEEVDALQTMGFNPIGFLVVPRCLALLLVLPCLTVVTDVMGMVGGFFIGTLSIGINPDLYYDTSINALVLKDVYTGLIKSGIFALIIALVSCHQGLSVQGGAEGVGKATTQAVVISIVLIIVVDCLATGVFYYAFP